MSSCVCVSISKDLGEAADEAQLFLEAHYTATPTPSLRWHTHWDVNGEVLTCEFNAGIVLYSAVFTFCCLSLLFG